MYPCPARVNEQETLSQKVPVAVIVVAALLEALVHVGHLEGVDVVALALVLLVAFSGQAPEEGKHFQSQQIKIGILLH